jgi:hypothetical protein
MVSKIVEKEKATEYKTMKLFSTISETILTTIVGILTTAVISLAVGQCTSTNKMIDAQKKNFSKYMNTHKWEYKVVYENTIVERKISPENLNILGSDGWELIDSYESNRKTVLVLKRRVKIQ